MSVDVKYTTTATATGGRDGAVKTNDNALNLKLSVPKALGGPGGEGNNPEQLFACGYAACFLGAMKAVAGKQKVTVPDDASVTATVGIGPRSEGGFGITVELEVHLPGMEREAAETLARTAHEDICPYSHATRGNVDVTVRIV